MDKMKEIIYNLCGQYGMWIIGDVYEKRNV
jgi:hypothetical protein